MSSSSPSSETTAKILEGIYKRHPAWLMDKYELVPATQILTLGGFEHTQSGLAFAVNRDFGVIDDSEALVVGGGCLGYCEGQIEKLGIEVVADMLYPICLARWLQCDCVMYLNVTEEAIVSEGMISKSLWPRLGDIMQRFAFQLAEILEVKRLHILRTDVPHVNSTIEAAVSSYATHLEAQLIDTLYAIDSSGKSSRRDEARISQYRRNLVGYLPSIIRTATGVPSTHIIAAENIHQVKAINKARTILLSEFSAGTDRLNHVVYLSPPSITGSKRMCRAGSKSAIYIMDERDQMKRKLDALTFTSRYYWDSIWPRLFVSKLIGKRSVSLLDIVGEIQKIFISCIKAVKTDHQSG